MPSKPRDSANKVTALGYCYRDKAEFPDAFARLAHAFCETWRLCGTLDSVIVVNQPMPCVERFAAEHPNLKMQIEPSLVPGSTIPLSVDCCSRLHERFSTPYVLTIQDDGWPLRAGLENFTAGEFDFIGAPHVRDIWRVRLAARVLDYRGMNGGFSLRSHDCCEMAAFWWRKKYRHLEEDPELSEDGFYTRFLPRHEREYRRGVTLADFETATAFAYQKMDRYRRNTTPFGFHSMKSLEELRALGLAT